MKESYRILNSNCRKVFNSKEELFDYIDNNDVKPNLFTDEPKDKIRISKTTYSEELIDFTPKIESLTSDDKIEILNKLKDKLSKTNITTSYNITLTNIDLINYIDEMLKLNMDDLKAFKLSTNYKPCNSVGLIIPEHLSIPFLPEGYVKRDISIGYRKEDITWGDKLIGRNVDCRCFCESTKSDFEKLLKSK
ncbi:hypothetical protein M0Q50_05245 [bacterium]|jgi:hypothetical protein|nr:hypothetical protein [bacterium]